MNSDKFMLFT